MKVTNVQSPNQIKQVTTNETAQKAKAVQAFNKASQAQAPAQVPETHQQPPAQAQPAQVNQNNISAEELSAVQGQNRIVEDTPIETSSPTPESKTPVQKDDQVSQQYQLLARKERQLRQQAQQLAQEKKAKEEQWASEKAQLEARLADLEKNTISRQRLKERTFDVLADEGITYDEVTQQAIDYQQKNPRYESHIEKLQAKIAQLEEKVQARDTEAQEASKQQYKAAISQIRTDAKQLITTDPNYKHIRAMDSAEDVVELIEATWKEERRVMSVEEAADEVEKYLKSEYEKINKRLSPPNASESQGQKTQQTTQTQPSKTLTNAASTTRKLSSRERALLAFKGELK